MAVEEVADTAAAAVITVEDIKIFLSLYGTEKELLFDRSSFFYGQRFTLR